MIPNGNNPKRATPTPMAGVLLGIVGAISAVIGLANGPGGHSEREAICGAGLVIFAGLCFVAAAIVYVAAQLRRND
jgi:hypothetical protein